MKVTIGKKQHGKCVLDILRGELGCSSALITFLKKREDGILVNGTHVTVRYILSEGDVLAINYEDRENDENQTVIPVELPLDIVYSDRDILVVNKPPYMPTHPSHDHQHDTLANAVAYHFKHLKTPFVFRAINRLDNQTSGLVLLARNKMAALHLSEDMAKGRVHKRYFAVLHGKLSPREGDINAPIRRREDSKIKREVHEDGARSLTRYKMLVENDMYSAVLAAPITGRTHQLRVHFSHMGCCICGDTLYGYPCEFIERQALHAVYLEFPHPSSGEVMSVTAPLPSDIRALCDSVFSASDRAILKKQKGLYPYEETFSNV